MGYNRTIHKFSKSKNGKKKFPLKSYWIRGGLNPLLTADSGAPEPQPTPPKKDGYSELVRCSPEATQESKSLGEKATSNKSPYSKGLQKIAVVSTRGLAGQKA